MTEEYQPQQPAAQAFQQPQFAGQSAYAQGGYGPQQQYQPQQQAQPPAQQQPQVQSQQLPVAGQPSAWPQQVQQQPQQQAQQPPTQQFPQQQPQNQQYQQFGNQPGQPQQAQPGQQQQFPQQIQPQTQQQVQPQAQQPQQVQQPAQRIQPQSAQQQPQQPANAPQQPEAQEFQQFTGMFQPEVQPLTSESLLSQVQSTAPAPAGPAPGAPQQAQQAPMQAQQMVPRGGRYEQAIPTEVRAAIGELDELANVSQWARTRLIQRDNAAACRACDDIHDSAMAAKEFMLRESPFASSVVQETKGLIEMAAQELQQHAGEPEIQETRDQARQTADTLQASLQWLANNEAGSAQ